MCIVEDTGDRKLVVRETECSGATWMCTGYRFIAAKESLAGLRKANHIPSPRRCWIKIDLPRITVRKYRKRYCAVSRSIDKKKKLTKYESRNVENRETRIQGTSGTR